ncbi:hypothetical protein ACIOHS_42735 [Streptomyces sp. NPDC088253]
MTTAVMNTTASRCSTTCPSAVAAGTVSAAASEMAPRIPAHASGRR